MISAPIRARCCACREEGLRVRARTWKSPLPNSALTTLRPCLLVLPATAIIGLGDVTGVLLRRREASFFTSPTLGPPSDWVKNYPLR